MVTINSVSDNTNNSLKGNYASVPSMLSLWNREKDQLLSVIPQPVSQVT